MILDTNIIIDFLKGKKEAVKLINNSKGVLGTTTITVFELFSGLKNDETEQISNFLGELYIFEQDKTSAILGGNINRQLISKGQQIDPQDCMIAGICIRNNLPLITTNKRHFERIENLQVL